jgi:hypothetical protein
MIPPRSNRASDCWIWRYNVNAISAKPETLTLQGLFRTAAIAVTA